MRRSCQSCNQNDNTNNYYNAPQTCHNNCIHLRNCRCQWGNNIAPRLSETSDYYSGYNSSCCSCEKCNGLCSDHCNCSDSSSGSHPNSYTRRNYADRTDYSVKKVLSKYYSRRRQYPTHLRNCNTYYSNNCYDNNGNISEEPHTVHPNVRNIPSHCVDILSKARLVSNAKTIPRIMDNSFHSCRACNSHQLETVYENTQPLSSRSTINRSSNQTIASKTSKGILKISFGDRKQKNKINSGYYEFVSPTRSESSGNPHVTPKNSKLQNTAVGLDMLKRPIHYGYFEVKERNYENQIPRQEKTTLLELDSVPTKMSKQIDTTQFKELMMLDKSLSANFGKVEIQTADKALFANMPPDQEKCLSQSDIERIVKRINKYSILKPKCSNKMVQSVSNKSFTNAIVSSSKSITKRKGSKVRKLKAAKSMSEGSIHIHKKTIYGIKRSQDQIGSYKNYLDAALDKLETQITKRIKNVLTNYSDVPKKKSVVTLYHKSLTSPLKEPHATQNENCSKSENGTNPSPTMVLPEDVVDSEEVEIDSSDFEKRSSLSHTCMNNSAKCNYNSDVSSYNTEGLSLLGGSQLIMDSKADNTCEFALIKQRSSQEQNNRFLRNRTEQTTKSGYQTHTSTSESLANRQSLVYQSGHSVTLNTYSRKDRQRSSGQSIHEEIIGTVKLDEQNNTKPSNEKLPPSTLDSPQPTQEGQSNWSRVPPPAIKQECICGRKPRDFRDKSIRFGYASLGTIEEESENGGDSTPALTLLHHEKGSSFDSINDTWKDGDTSFSKRRRDINRPSKSISDQYARLSNESIRNIPDPSKVNLFKVGKSYQRNDRFSFEDFLYDDSIRQECPRNRYYAKKQALYNQERCRRNIEKRPDKLYSYMLDVPPYRASNRYRNIGVLNLISFVIFLVMFYGIFQYIDVGVRTGKFPWT